LIAFLLLVGSAYRISLRLDHPFTKLFAAGLATLLGVQTIVIVGGVTGFLPLTGITLPFVSYGGSSLLVNSVILVLLLRTSADAVVVPPSTPAGATYQYLRPYPYGAQCGNVTVFYSSHYGATEIEDVFNDQPTGRDPKIGAADLIGLLRGRVRTGTVQLTIDA